ncbi:ATP-binding protein [Thioalkalivibrio sp. ALE19]|uniref:AAA family ATPase n=1 Tax=Thioalkalivibrio sp. ALE19 TaxID=1266909 RepID=UPI00048D750A|nr:ATP-binding protein [Thioalkalivibrio sp. ALE19]
MPVSKRRRSRKSFRSARRGELPGNLGGIRALWALRVLRHALPMDLTGTLLRSLDDDMLQALGVDHDGDIWDDTERVEAVIERADAVEQQAGPLQRDHPIARNVRLFGEPLGLSECEREVLQILALNASHHPFASLLSSVRDAVDLTAEEIVAVALGRSLREVREALSPRNTLVRSGLVETEGRGMLMSNQLGFDLLGDLASELVGRMESAEPVFSAFFRPMPEPEGDQMALAHLEQPLARLRALLGQAASQNIPGVNILLYGPPGTGKTQLVRRLAQELGLEGREVNHETPDGTPMDAPHRQRAYQLCQYLLRRAPRSLVAFDEIEDVFGQDPLAALFGNTRRGPRTGGKAWTNQMLEDNPVPAIWITNHPEQLDPAYLRRFDFTLEVGHPPRSVRRALMARACEGLEVSDEWLDHMAGIEGLTPAEIQRSARVARLLNQAAHGESAESVISDHLSEQAELQGRPPLAMPRAYAELEYGLENLNTEGDVDSVLEDLVLAGSGSLLAHGPPGTGKTALAHHLAQRADRPLRKRTASELISPYVGQTEKNLARAFREARREGAVLLLDEADSFLTDRSSARHSWETTRTNELLVQIEAFSGILVCATNFLEALDPAALRRFDHKLELRPLTMAQRVRLFERLVERLQPVDASDGCATESARATVQRLEQLTPGDFATVVRAHTRRQGTGDLTQEALAEALAAEQRIKPGAGRRAAGFA